MHMAYPTKNKSLCKTCSKEPSIFFCQGCQKDFCTDHAKEHRQDLSKQLDTIIHEHNSLQQNLSECIEKSSNYPFMKDIDHWEMQSIDKIRQIADEARKQVLDIIGNRTIRVSEEIKSLTQELTKARAENNFIELDLKDWMETLNKWNIYLSTPPSIEILQDKNDTLFISKIIVSLDKNEFFERVAGNIKIEDHGQVAIADSNDHSTVRCQGEYAVGRHRFRFKIEQFSNNNWIYFGIVSKHAPLQETSCRTPTSFGWVTNGWVLLNASGQPGYNGYKSDIIQNDTVELFVDCDRRTIRLTNERTNSQHQLDVNVIECPFPWQLHIGLRYQNDQVRYLKT